jgi:YggT family protein
VLLAIALQVLYLLVLVFLYILLARFVLNTVMSFGRRWHPSRGSAAALEVVWTVTDPPLKALRRVIPPLRLGTVSLDLSAFILLIILIVLQNFVLDRLISWAVGLA